MGEPRTRRHQASLHLDPDDRTALVHDLLARLREASPGSRASLRGSLAEGRGDQYSDIDVLWIAPDRDFRRCVDALASVLAAVRPVESVRSDPEFQNSAKRRLLFLRFDDTPLFWRLDLDARAQSVGDDVAYDRGNPAARGTDWSLTESALANAVAAVKAHLRTDDRVARELLDRAYRRIGLETPDLDLRGLILTLVRAVRARDPEAVRFAGRIEQLTMSVFGPG